MRTLTVHHCNGYKFIMRRLANLATLILTICLGYSIAISSTVFAQQTTQTDGATSNSTPDKFVSEIISAAEQGGIRVIVIDGTAQKDNSFAANTQRIDPDLPTAGDYDTLTMTMTPSNGSSLMRAQSEVLEFRKILKAKLAEIPGSIIQTENALKAKSPTGDLHPFIRALYWSVLLLVFGAWIEREIYVKRIVARWLEPDLKDHPKGYLEKFPLLVKRATLKVIGVFLSMGVAFLTGTILFKENPPESIQFTIAALYIGYAACRLLAIIWRMILAPYLCQYRIPHFSTKDSRKLYHWLWVLSSVNILLIMIGIWVGELGGRSHIHAALASIFSAIVASLNILMVIFNRKALSRAIRNGKKDMEVGAFPRLLSKVWLVVAIGYFTFSWLEMTYRVVIGKPISTPLIAGAYGILVSVICVYALINYFIERFFQREKHYITMKPEQPSDDETTSEPPVSASTTTTEDNDSADIVMVRHPLSTYEDLARRVAGILAGIVGVWALTKIWNINHDMMMDSSGLQQSMDAIAILFIGYIVYHIVRIWIDNKIQEEGGEVSLAPGDEGGASGASRLATLLPLFRNFMLLVISLSVIFSALLELGINVSPLFASAGVVGLAIGFGAQTLVRDIFSGAFYLFDDAFRRGEYVDIGSVKGTVEKISVRSFQLRHHLGPLHTIPFGEIQTLTNYSRDWVMMKLPLRLTYDTDPEKVRKLIKKLGQSLLLDPEIGDTFLQPLKSQGVLEMQDSAMIFRVKFMAKPGDQWVIRKRVYQEIRDLFDKEGIMFAHKQVTVRLAGDVPERLTEQQTKAIAAAAVDDDDDDNNDSPSSGDDR